jgi:hypothetical protein
MACEDLKTIYRTTEEKPARTDSTAEFRLHYPE